MRARLALAQAGRSWGLDITARSATPEVHALAPGSALAMGCMQRAISQEQCTTQYVNGLEEVPVPVWRTVYRQRTGRGVAHG